MKYVLILIVTLNYVRFTVCNFSIFYERKYAHRG